jgi:hypothetical protein
VGSALHDHAVRAMFESGRADAYLWAVPGNQPAEKFYTNRGWHGTPDVTSVSTPAGQFPLGRWICRLPLASSVLPGG